MRRKSKFIAFILSGIPGLSHLYVGLKEKALIFFMVFLGLAVGSIGLAALTYNDVFAVLLAFGYPILWLISLIDLFSTWKKAEIREIYNGDTFNMSGVDQEMSKKTATMALSIIPGAGHMYLGYQKKGLFLMGIFFFSIFFMGWLGISMLLFLLPLIWFYSFFDAMHIVDDSKDEIEDLDFSLPAVKPEWIGFGLIGLGIVIILERILFPLIDYKIRSYIQTSVVSLIFIVLGVYILRKNASNNIEDDEEEIEDEE